MNSDELNALMHGTMPFTATLSIEPISATKDEVIARLQWNEATCTAGGAMHGGALMALADSTGALCAFLNLADGATTTTIESKTNFVRGVRDGAVEAASRPLHVGRTIVIVETEIRNALGKLVAKTTQTQAVLKG
jgi:1,4-dihydroxy-2-naphthoyl-CoA hydrolase